MTADTVNVDTLVERLGRVLVQYERAMIELGWTMADVRYKETLSDLAARARDTDEAERLYDEAEQRITAMEADRDRLARRVAELEAALERIGKGYHMEDHDYTGACNGRCAQKIARAALAGDGDITSHPYLPGHASYTADSTEAGDGGGGYDLSELPLLKPRKDGGGA